MLFYFGLVNFLAGVIFLALTKLTTIQVYNVNAWYKPFKFAVSTGIYSWTMAWFCYYLPSFNIRLFNWAVIILLGFEVIYISIQAGRGQLSHYNSSTSIYSALYSLMALAATLITVYTAYIGVLFFAHDFSGLPVHFVWSIRLGIVLFVIFSFEGFVMGSRLTHTIGGPDGGEGLPVLNWSTKYGDPRVAHFVGMHALQVLPLLSFYLLKNTKLTILVAILYGMLAFYTLFQALQAKPLVKISRYENTGRE